MEFSFAINTSCGWNQGLERPHYASLVARFLSRTGEGNLRQEPGLRRRSPHPRAFPRLRLIVALRIIELFLDFLIHADMNN